MSSCVHAFLKKNFLCVASLPGLSGIQKCGKHMQESCALCAETGGCALTAGSKVTEGCFWCFLDPYGNQLKGAFLMSFCLNF